jgi:hypothetical protein
MPADCRHFFYSAEKALKKERKTLTVYIHPPTFALPKENWDLQNVSANPNQITVLRSQPGG